MVDGSVLAPGSLDARYEELSGGREHALEIYLAARYFQLSPKEWDDLPWWVRRTYIEGLEEEQIIGSPEVEHVQKAASSRVDIDPLGARDEEFRALGLTVIDGSG